MACELSGEALVGDEQSGVVDVRRWPPRKTLRDPHQREPSDGGVVDRVDHDQPARPQHATHLRDDAGNIVNVFEDLTGHHDRRRLVGDRQSPGVGLYRHDTMAAGGAERRERHVDTDVRVAGNVLGQDATATPDVNEDVAGRSRRREELTSRPRQPVERGERALRSPPLVDQVVVLASVVASEPRGSAAAAMGGQKMKPEPASLWRSA